MTRKERLIRIIGTRRNLHWDNYFEKSEDELWQIIHQIKRDGIKFSQKDNSWLSLAHASARATISEPIDGDGKIIWRRELYEKLLRFKIKKFLGNLFNKQEVSNGRL